MGSRHLDIIGCIYPSWPPWCSYHFLPSLLLSQHKQISSVLKRTGISRTPDSVTNTMIAMMEFQERLGPDGLVFDPYSRKREPCDHFFNVDCGDRLDLQPPQGPSDLCPRLNGFYSHPDPSVCHIFYTCSNGQAQENTCTPGLWFDEYTGVCNWPDNTDRQDCKAEAYALETSNGFQCPPRPEVQEGAQFDPHPRFADAND